MRRTLAWVALAAFLAVMAGACEQHRATTSRAPVDPRPKPMAAPQTGTAMTAVEHVLQAPALARVAPELRPLVRWSIRIEAARPSDNDLPVGASKFGGAPDLPAGLAWPVYTPPPGAGVSIFPGAKPPPPPHTPIPLVAQIRLSDVAPFDHEHALPRTGWLSFFSDPFGMWQVYGRDTDVYADPRQSRVLFWPDESTPLTRRTPPGRLPPDRPWRVSALSFRAEQTLPHVETTWIGDGGKANGFVRMGPEEWGAYADLRRQWVRTGMCHRLLGYSDDVQPYRLENGYRDARALLFPELGPAKGATDEALEAEYRRGRLLFQVQSHDDMDFGRWGCGAFFIREDDLKARRFDRVWFSEA